jgi:hypothetical protein
MSAVTAENESKMATEIKIENMRICGGTSGGLHRTAGGVDESEANRDEP